MIDLPKVSIVNVPQNEKEQLQELRMYLIRLVDRIEMAMGMLGGESESVIASESLRSATEVMRSVTSGMNGHMNNENIHVTSEEKEAIGRLAESKAVIFGTTEPTDTNVLFVDTANNKIKIYKDSAWVAL